MRNKAIPSIVVLLVVTAGIVNSVRSQNAPAKSSDADHARHSLAINLLRAINTAEVNYKMKHGAFLSKDELLANEEFSGKAMAWAARNDPHLTGAQLSSGPEILPGWALRLNVTADGQGYDVLLEDTTDKNCGYAAVTDERGVIRQSKAIDCPI
jgi:hypothetical protein